MNKFRKLSATEIECRISGVNKGGVKLLLYKNARADMNILDEVVGPAGWQRDHKELKGNMYAGIGIWDDAKKQWVWKWDCGTESSDYAQKGEASDSFKRAGTNWGIGRELYTAPQIFIPAARLHGFSYNGDTPVCYDRFSVKEITYDGDNIRTVEVALKEYGREYDCISFSNDEIPAGMTLSGAPDKTPAVNRMSEAEIFTPEVLPAKRSVPVRKEPEPVMQQEPETVPAAPGNTPISAFADDEIILIGSCRGKKYGDVKDTALFRSFLNWVKKSTTTYPDQKQNDQFQKLKEFIAAA